MNKKTPPADPLISPDSFVFDKRFQEARQKSKVDNTQVASEQGTGLRSASIGLQYDASEYDKYLKSNDFGGSAADLDGRLGDRQGAMKQWANGLGRFLPIVGTKILSSLAGMRNSVEDAFNGFDGSVYTDDKISEGIAGWEEEIKAQLPIYAKTGYNEGGILSQMATAKFWADEGLDGLAFMTSAAAITYATAGIGGAAMGGLGVAGKAGALAANAGKMAKLAASGISSLGWGAYSASQEAAIEAYGTAQSVKEQLEGKMNPETGMLYTEQDIKARAAQAASSTFSANAVALLLPGAWEARIILGLGKKAAAKGLANAAKTAIKAGKVTATELIQGVGAEALKRSGTRAFVKGAIEGFAIEGLWEENVQSAIQNYDIDNAVNGKSPGFTDRTLEYAEGMLENLGTTEGQKAIVLGGVIGGPMGGFSSRQGVKSFNRATEPFVQSLSAANRLMLDNTRSYLKTHPEDVKDAEGNVVTPKGTVMLDENGNPQVDEKAAMQLTQQVMNTKRLADKHSMAALQGNDALLKLNTDISIASQIWSAATNQAFDSPEDGVSFLKWHHEQILREQAEAVDNAIDEATQPAEGEEGPEASKGRTEAKTAVKKATAADQAYTSGVINKHLMNIDSMVNYFKEVRDKAADLNKVDQSPERTAFNDVLKKGMFYERIKQSSIRDMIQDKQAELATAAKDRVHADKKTITEERIEKELEGLQGALQDSVAKYNQYYERPEEVFDAWDAPQAQIRDLQKKLKPVQERIKELTDLAKKNDTLSAEETSELEGLNKQRREMLYTQAEILRKEGPIFKDQFSGQNVALPRESIIAEEQRLRVQQKTGLRYEYYEKAATGVKALVRIKNKMEAIQADTERVLSELEPLLALRLATATPEAASQLRITSEVLGLVDLVASNLPILDDATVSDVQAIIEGREAIITKLDEIEQNLEPEGWESRTEQSEALEQILDSYKMMVRQDVDQAKAALEQASSASTSNEDLFSPEKIEDHLTETIAREYKAKGDHILRIATDPDGRIKEDFMDVRSTQAALEDATMMHDVIKNRHETGDLQGKTQFSTLVKETAALIAKLQDILNMAHRNKNNRDAKQADLNRKEGLKLVDLLTDPENTTAKLINQALGGKLQQLISEAEPGILHETMTAIVNHALSKVDRDALQIAIKEDKQRIGRELLKHLDEGFAYPNDFIENPEMLYYPDFVLAIQHKYGTRAAVDKSKQGLIARFMRDNDVYDLIARIKATPEGSPLLMAPKEELIQIYEMYQQLVTLTKLSNTSVTNNSAAVAGLSKAEALVENKFAPTTQQDIAIRDMMTWYESPKNPDNNWAYLRGIAGTGKTNVAFKWFLALAGIKTDEIVTAAGLKTAAGVVAKAAGTDARSFQELMDMDLTGKRLVVIDEYGTLTLSEMFLLRKKIEEHNAAIRKNTPTGSESATVKVMILGDPTQISPKKSTDGDITVVSGQNKKAVQMTVINPLTVVYRSDVSAINEVSDLFQAETTPVKSISARSNKAVGEAGAIGVQTILNSDTILSTVQANIEDAAASKRTRVIIVEDEAGVQKYSNALASAGIQVGEGSVQVMTVYEAQSMTFDEVYVDLPIDTQNDVAKSNTKMYTATSRAKEFAMVIYPESQNTKDESLLEEKEANINQVKEARQAYYAKKAKEVQIFNNLQKGDALNKGLNQAAEAVKPTNPKPAAPTPTEDGEIDLEEDEYLDVNEDVEETPDDISKQVSDEGDPYMGGTVQTDKPNAAENIPNIDKEGSEALKRGEIGVGDTVFHVYAETPFGNKKKDKERSIQILALTQGGRLVRIGQIFQDQMHEFPSAPMQTREDVEKAVEAGDPSLLQAGTIKTSKITEAQYLHFKYQSGKNQKKGIVDTLKAAFSSVFPSETKVSYHIFSKKIKGNWGKLTIPDALVGKPVAIIRPENAAEDDFTNAKFVELKAQALSEDDANVQELREFYDAAEAVDALVSQVRNTKVSNIRPGNESFENIIHAMKGALELVDGPQSVGKGISKVMQVRTSPFTYAEFSNAYREYVASDKKTEPGKVMLPITEQEYEKTREHLVKLAQGYYGVATFKQVTKDENGESTSETVVGLKGAQGTAQRAFNRIAKANEFVGSTRIRQATPLKGGVMRNSGKSLISTIGSSENAVYPLLKAIAKMQGATSKEDVKAAVTKIKKEARAAQKENEKSTIEVLREYVTNLGGDVQTNLSAFDIILNERTTPPVTLETLKAIVSPENFKDGRHSTTYKDSDGETQPAYLRKPLSMTTFNKLGKDPEANAPFFEEAVTTNFESVSPTRIRVEEVQSQEATTAPVTDLNQDDTEVRREDLRKQIKEAKAKGEDTTALMEQFKALRQDVGAVTHQFLPSVSKNVEQAKVSVTEAVTATQKQEALPVEVKPKKIDFYSPNIEDGKRSWESKVWVEGASMYELERINDTLYNLYPSQAATGLLFNNRTETIKNLFYEMNLFPKDGSGVMKVTKPAVVEIADGKVRIIEKGDVWYGEVRRAYNASVRPSVSSVALSQAEAAAELRRLMPSISEDEMEFLEKSILAKMARPGEDLLGLFKRGKIYVALDQDGRIPRSVLRHEAFHKIFNQYLSREEQQALKQEIDPQNHLSLSEFDEQLADRFMDWKATPESFSERVGRIFNKILSWLGFARNNALTLDRLFRDIEAGRYTQQTSNISTVRRAFNKIAEAFGDSMTYKAALNTVEGEIKRLKHGELERTEVYTKPEMKIRIRRNLEGYRSDIEFEEEMGEVISDQDKALKLMLDKLLDKDHYDRLWKTIYKGYTEPASVTDVEDVASFEDFEDSDNWLGDLVQDSDVKNEEGSATDRIKDAVSYIEYRGRVINPRMAYAVTLKLLQGLHSKVLDRGHKAESINNQIGARMEALGIKEGTAAYRVASYLSSVFDRAEASRAIINIEIGGKKTRIERPLTDDMRFLNANSFVISREGEDISHKGSSQISTSTEEILNREGDNTPNFIRSIAMRIVDRDPSKFEGYTREDALRIAEITAKHYFRKYEAQQEAAAVFSHFASHREAEYYKGEMLYDNGFQFRYVKAYFSGKEAQIRTQLKDAIDKNWAKNEAEIKGILKTASKNKKADYAATVKEVFDLIGVAVPEEGARNVKNDAREVFYVLQGLQNQFEANARHELKVRADDTQEETTSHKSIAEEVEDSRGYISALTDYLVGDEFLQAKKYKGADGKNRFPFHLGSQALENVQRLMESQSIAKVSSAPAHIKDTNIFKRGVGKILRIIDHDGFGWKGINFAVSYANENSSNWMTRAFGLGFLGYASVKTSSTSYIQYFYTNSNKPSQKGAEVKILSFKEQQEGLKAMLDQHLNAEDIVDIKGYDKYKAVNNDIIVNAIDEVLGTKDLRKDGKARAELAKKYAQITPAQKEEVVAKATDRLSEMAKETLDFISTNDVRMTSDISSLVRRMQDARVYNPKYSNVNLATAIEYDGATKKHTFSSEGLLPTVEAWVANNYINGYFLNEVAAGDMNFFKSALDMGKRLSSVFGSGKKGMIGKFHMRPTAQVAIINDPRFSTESLSKALEGTAVASAIAKATAGKDGGFELADGQGYMTPQRKEELIRGFGEEYGAGDIFKPIYSGTYTRQVKLRDGSTKAVEVPAILKDSVIVLTDELVAQNPLLAELRQAMYDAGADEAVMASGTKEGAPLALTEGVAVSEISIIEIDNDKYRLQLNPISKPYKEKGTSVPTQLLYISNTMNQALGLEQNKQAADSIYSALSNLYERGLAKFKAAMLDENGKIKATALANTMNPETNERLIALLESGANYNLSMLADKIYSQVANSLTKFTTKIKFPGGKLVSQSAFGIERKLEFVEEGGRIYAEVLLPEAYRKKAELGSFILPDGLAYRIPSTGLNSVVGFKVVGYYPSKGKGANIIVGPAELVTQMGSDFDVDSLFLITRAVKNGHPVGYIQGADGKYLWAPDQFRELYEVTSEIEEMIQINTIVENLLHIASDVVNKPRIADVVSTQPIVDVLNELGLNDEVHVDMSSPLGNMKFHQSNFQGLKLTGIFANISKSLAYMVNAGAGEKTSYPQMRKEVVVDGITYNSFTEQADKEQNIWQILSALVNSAVDNVKEQQLYKMNASNLTGKMYGSALAIGMPLKQAVMLMAQPSMRLATEAGKIELVRPKIVEALKKVAPEKYTGSVKDTVAYLKEEVSPSTLTSESLLATLNKEDLSGMTEEELLLQMAVLNQAQTLETIGDDISTFSTMIYVIQGFPSSHEDLQKIEKTFDKTLIRTPDGYTTAEGFSFDISNLFKEQPNIERAYLNMKELLQIIEANIFKHAPMMEKFVDEVEKKYPIKLDYKANRSRIKQEAVSYLTAAMYADSLETVPDFEYQNHNGVERVATGKEAWTQWFIQTYEKQFGKKDNEFLSALAVRRTRGLNRITFAIDSNINSLEELMLSEGFEQIQDQEFRDGLVKYAVLHHGMGFGYRNFSAYMSPRALGAVNDWLAKLDEQVREVEVTTHTNEETGEVTETKRNVLLDNIQAHFAFSMIANNAGSLPGFPKNAEAIPQRVDPNDPSKGFKKVEIREPDGSTRTRDVLSGVAEDGTYYDKEFNNLDKEIEVEEQDMVTDVTDGGQEQETDVEVTLPVDKPETRMAFPLFVKEKFNKHITYLMRVSGPKEERARYVRMGYQAFGGYEIPSYVLRGGWNPATFFKKGVIPLKVLDTQADTHEVYSPVELTPGTRVIAYNFNNSGTRDRAVETTIKEASDQGNNRYKVTLNDKTPIHQKEQLSKVLTPEQRTSMDKMAPAIASLVARFGIPLNVVSPEQMPGGHADAKGLYFKGQVYLNAAMMTSDTAFHEIAHPIISAIREKNPIWYQALVAEMTSSEQGKRILALVKLNYPELSASEQMEEALVTLIGETAAGRMDQVSTLAKLIKRLMRAIGKRVQAILKEMNISGLGNVPSEQAANLNLMDLAQVLTGEKEALNPELTKLDSDSTKLTLQKSELDEVEIRLFKEGRITLSCR